MWPTVAEVLLRMHSDLDRDWSLADAAALAGYDPHHFAHAFRAIVGEPPARHIRRLRLERAAAALREDTASIADVALASRYQSIDTFARAFRRAFGVTPSAFRALGAVGPSTDRPVPQPNADGYPAEVAAPTIAPLSPLQAWTVPVTAFHAEAFVPAVRTLAATVPIDGPWQTGCLAQPWGWMGRAFRRDLRAARFVTDLSVARPPLLPWRSMPEWYATFEYEGPIDAVHPVFDWIMREWIPRAGLRPAFLPMIGQLEHFDAARTRARLHAPIRRLMR